jgi:hypothetical protein
VTVVSTELTSSPTGWRWAVCQGGETLACGNVESGDEGLAAARLALDDLLDAGLEDALCKSAWLGSRLRGISAARTA